MEPLFKCHFSVTSALTAGTAHPSHPAASLQNTYGLTCYVIYLCTKYVHGTFPCTQNEMLPIQSIQSVGIKRRHLAEPSIQYTICSVKVKLSNADRAPRTK